MWASIFVLRKPPIRKGLMSVVVWCKRDREEHFVLPLVIFIDPAVQIAALLNLDLEQFETGNLLAVMLVEAFPSSITCAKHRDVAMCVEKAKIQYVTALGNIGCHLMCNGNVVRSRNPDLSCLKNMGKTWFMVLIGGVHLITVAPKPKLASESLRREGFFAVGELFVGDDWGSWANFQVDIHRAPELASFRTLPLFQLPYIQKAVERDAELKIGKLAHGPAAHPA